ncbi:MAG: DUF1700 domain-containing protein [Clostridia bacterium]|jgi:uncharacterized membrane protein|nr:DUF1700 domain-containing protein [Clostridia bacterium]MBT7122783.1 DUF1700 domain-containing protein [Clostridia bacterium]
MMNDYLNKLEKSLRRMSANERKEIVADYREHFEIGLEAGKSIEQIIASLGDPSELAKMYTALGATNRAHESKGVKDTLHMLGAILRFKVGGGLLIASLYFAALSTMLAAFAAAVGLIGGGLAALGYAVYMFTQGYIAYGFLGIFAGLVLSSGGLLGFIANIKLWKLSVGNLTGVAHKIMQKRVTNNELDIDKG